MPFCVKCGEQLADGTRFCPNCGTPAVEISQDDDSHRRVKYEGELHKCPNCGETIDSFVTNCPACGHELRGSEVSRSVQVFALKLNGAATEQQKIDIIRSFPIPNTKEDIFEFMIMASTNISSEPNKEVFNAWIAKFEQSYQKAKILLGNDSSLVEVQRVYSETKRNINKSKATRSAKAVGTAVGKSGGAVGRILSKNAYALPNIAVCAAWVISVLILIPLCKGPDGSEFQMFMFFDFIAGVIFVPFLSKSKSSLPRLIVTIGLIVSTMILILLCRGPYNDDYSMMLFFDIIASIIIILLMFSMAKNSSDN